MYCKNCGVEIKDDANFCEKCGTSTADMKEDGLADVAAGENPEKSILDTAQNESTVQVETNAKPEPEKTDCGDSKANCAFILGIISIVLWFFGYTAIVSPVLGIIGILQASKSKKLGCNSGIRTAGFVMSLVGLVGGAITLALCIIAVGVISGMIEYAGSML